MPLSEDMPAVPTRLSTVFEQVPAFIATLRGPEHIYELANPAYRKLTGHRDLIGRPVREALPELEEQGFFDILDRVYASGEEFVGTELPVVLQGTAETAPTTHYLNFTYQPLEDGDGAIFGVLVHGADVTELVLARQQAEEQAVELEAQAEELQNQALQMEEIQTELEASNFELARANHEAEAARARLEAVLRQLPSGAVIAAAPSGRLLMGNDQVERIWGHPFLSAAAVGEYDQYRGFHPDGRPYQPAEWPLARSLQGERVMDEEIEIVRGDESRAVISVSSAPVHDRSGSVVAAVAIFDDVTETRRYQSEVAYLAETTRILSSSLDYQETLRSVAHVSVPRIADWCAVDVLEGGTAVRLAVVHSDPSRARLAEEIARRWPVDPAASTGVANVLRTGEPELHPELTDEILRAASRDEEHFRVLKDVGLRSAMIVPMIARERTLGAITFVAAESGRRYGPRDLVLAEKLASRAAVAIDNARLYSEARQARREAEQAQLRSEESRREAEFASSAKSDFLAKMSHEIRTPLNAVIGYADLLHLGIGGSLNEKQQDHVERIRTSSQHLLSLVDEILDLARIESGRMRVQQNRVRVSDSVAAALEMVRPQATQRGVEVEDRCATDSSTVYVGDEDRVRQILTNLVGNAVKFSRRGDRVTVTCGLAERDGNPRDEEQGPWTFIRVQDTGIGISTDQLETIFHPFVQAQNGYTRETEGTGLGLAISRQLAILMGGEITVISRPEHGSTFTLWLPNEPPVEDPLDLRGDQSALPRGLAKIGDLLVREADAIVVEYRGRVRRDPGIPMARSLHDSEIGDHHPSLIADFGAGLAVLSEPSDAQERLLRDSSQIQHTLADLHGRQRAQLGWTEEALEREFGIFRDVLCDTVRHGLSSSEVDVEAGLKVLERFLERAETISIRGFRIAAANATRLPG